MIRRPRGMSRVPPKEMTQALYADIKTGGVYFAYVAYLHAGES